VLEKLGMPWIPGHKPVRHSQGAIVEAIERYLGHNPAALDVPQASPLVPAADGVFVPPPTPTECWEKMPASLRRLIGEFNPVGRDLRNRALGRTGEEFVLEFERRQLAGIGWADLAREVRWITSEKGADTGYGVLSFAPTG